MAGKKARHRIFRPSRSLRRLALSLGISGGRVNAGNVQTQKMLMYQYGTMPSGKHLRFRDVGWGAHSQHDEDGILLYIFSRIGARTYCCVEISAGDGIECNTANLLLNHRWTGVLVDGAPHNVAIARKYYRARTESRYWLPEIIEAWVNRENVNDIISSAGVTGEIDLLSLDIDGMDYWVWEALDAVSPRIVVLEFNHLLGPDVSLSVPYDPGFVADLSSYGSDYAGASLSAFVKLGRCKGYRFIGNNSIGTNAFFARNDISHDLLPEARIEDAFRHPRAQFGMRVRYENVKHRAWVEV